MPGWVLSILLQLLWSLGRTYLKQWISADTKFGKWLRTKFPAVDWDNIVPVLEQIDQNKKKLKEHCSGPMCPLEPLQPQ